MSLASTAWASEGLASWFGEPYHGRRMANGQVYDMYDPTTAASREFPLGTWLQVTSISNGNRVEVQVRDRGGAHALDLSYAAFSALASPSAGLIRIRYEVIAGPGQPPASVAAASQPASPPAAAPSSSAPAAVSPPASAPATAPLAIDPGPGRYTVQSGDTLISIARRFGHTTAELVAWNDLSDADTLRPGWVLRVEPPARSEPVAAASSPPVTARPAGGGQVYVVQVGDTLWRIADRFRLDPDALARANGLGPDAIIRVGQELVISTADWYIVTAGDSLRSIAERFGISVEELIRLNTLPDPDHLALDQPIRVR